MVNHELFDLFQQDSINKQAKIEYSGGTMSNVELFQNSEDLTEKLCSEKELRFGCCEASCFKFKVANIVKPLIGEWIGYSLIIDNREDIPFPVGRYKVASDNLTADRMHREIVAYDAMYDILNADVAAWYNAILPDKESTVTLRQFREAFVSYFDLDEAVPEGGLVNDGMAVERTIDPSEISGKVVITAICEINGCFGHIGRDGKFHYIYLPQAVQGLYPANDLYPDHAPDYLPYQQKTGHLYPQDPKGEGISKGLYISCDYEDFVTQGIDKIQIRQEENDIGYIYGSGSNCYIIQDNFLVYGKSAEQLKQIAENLYGKISNISYRPVNRLDLRGNPCFEVGDPIRLITKYDIVESYILKRTLKGVQALRDNYSAGGVLEYGKKMNSVRESIIQLKGKANILTRTLEETKLEMYDIEKELSTTITVTARDIRAELKNEVEGLNNTISITAGNIRAELKNTKEGLESSISQTASQIRTEVSNVSQNLQSQITQNAGEIDLRVRQDNVIASINLSPETITLEAGRIDLKGLVNATELVTKFATITTLNATKASLENLIATKATINDLNATNATVNNLSVNKLSVDDFIVANANLQNLIAQKIDASTVKADYMEVKNWTSAGYIKAERIDANMIVAKLGEFSGQVKVLDLIVDGVVSCRRVSMGALSINASCKWQSIRIDGNNYTVLCQ